VVLAADRCQFVIGDEERVAACEVVDLEERRRGAALAPLPVRAAVAVSFEDANASLAPCAGRALGPPPEGMELAASLRCGNEPAAGLARESGADPKRHAFPARGTPYNQRSSSPASTRIGALGPLPILTAGISPALI
jgi:hypothetical protein